jgi:hypothetical protein
VRQCSGENLLIRRIKKKTAVPGSEMIDRAIGDQITYSTSYIRRHVGIEQEPPNR